MPGLHPDIDPFALRNRGSAGQANVFGGPKDIHGRMTS